MTHGIVIFHAKNRSNEIKLKKFLNNPIIMVHHLHLCEVTAKCGRLRNVEQIISFIM